MGDSKNPQPEGDETTILHLGEFKNKQSAPPAEEGATIFIKRVAKETVEHSAAPVVVPSAAGPLCPEEMLGAVAYCYAKGVFSSADIERKMLQDAEFREAMGGVVPDPQTIRRFRRLNRAAIQEVLEKFYLRLRREKPPTNTLPGAKPAEPAPAAVQGAPSAPPVKRKDADPGDSTVMFIKRQATDRLDKATFIDGMSQDQDS